MTTRTSGSRPPATVLVGGAGAIPLGVDVARTALAQARARGFVTHQTNQPSTLELTPQVAELADFSWAVDFADPEESAAWARRQYAEGQRFDVVIGVREYAQVATAEIAAAVGAPGNPPEAVRTVRTKDRCRAALAAAGLPQPAFRVCADRAEAESFVAATSGPWVVKPRDAMGSEGVREVGGPGDLDAAIAALPAPAAGAPRPPFLVEEFVEGDEFSVEGVFLGGAPHVLAVTRKRLVNPPLFVEAGHVLPAPLPEDVRALLERETVRALRALGLRFGVFHVELWHTAGGVVLGEVHVRNGGDWIHTLLGYAIPGLELFGLVYDDALGRLDGPPPAPSRAAAVRFLVPPPGVVERVEGWEAIRRHPSVLRAELSVEPGARVLPVTDSHGRAGEIVVGAETPERAESLAEELAESVKFVMVEG
ncbi:ATP-grasp domain-containing protein [Microbispora bryophytorum]|uniref:ATP-grasp domain-containing protein n=1 Tax=Microbispora bryophytorum TaxID=1460882 RepID=UPI0033F60A95